MSRARWLLNALRLPLACAVLALGAGCNDGTVTPIAPPETVPFSQIDLVVGTGAEATAGKRAIVNYTGWLYDATKVDNKGTQFDTSIGRSPLPVTLGAGQVIKGFEQGVTGMKVGGQRRLVIPPSLAFGTTGVPNANPPIPPNATLVFDVELLDIQ
jgi:FKBP-type peptidyl-prolyl cis-trans isomerase FkpA